MQLDPSMFADSEDSSDSSDESDEKIKQASSKYMSVESISEGIKVHLDYNKNRYPYFKLFISKENSSKDIYFIQNTFIDNNDIIFSSVVPDNEYSVCLYLYTTIEDLKSNKPLKYDKIHSITAVGGSGEYTFNISSTNQKANYDTTIKTLTFNTITSSNQSYESRQTFDLYVYTLTPMAPVNGQTDLTELTILEKFPNLEVLTTTDNTYDVSQVLQQYCVDNNLQSLQFGLVEKLQFRKAGETDYLYEVIYYDTVFSRHDPYTYTRN
ncbi:hypothetical protein [Treponema bryantii]|uniref:hypothetical protein n=1 Tax=Treponema bryantii TaxID=163 RepID=UPI0012DF500A|nr:hypothetical protein [Treponema bryantii]